MRKFRPRRKAIFIPSPLSFTSFDRRLHEIGHTMSEHYAWDGKPEYLWEYETFIWALKFSRETKIKFPVRTVNYERSLIAENLHKQIGIDQRKIDRNVIAFIKEGGEVDPDVVYVKKHISDDGMLLRSSD